MLISPTKTMKEMNNIKLEKTVQRKLSTTIKKYHKTCKAQILRMATQQSSRSLLPMLLHPLVQKSLEPRGIASKEFHFMG